MIKDPRIGVSNPQPLDRWPYALPLHHGIVTDMEFLMIIISTNTRQHFLTNIVRLKFFDSNCVSRSHLGHVFIAPWSSYPYHTHTHYLFSFCELDEGQRYPENTGETEKLTGNNLKRMTR